MSPPEPPKPRGDQASRGTPARPTSGRLSVTEIDATPGRRHTPVPAADTRPTAPPPFAPDRRAPPREFQAARPFAGEPKPRATSPGIVVPRLEAPAAPSMHDFEEEKTIVGLGPSDDDGDRDSGLHSAHGVFTLLEQQKRATDVAKAEAARLADELAAVKRAPAIVAAPERDWHRLFYGIGTGIVLLIGAATAWLEAHTSKVETHVDNVAEKVHAQKVVTDPIAERLDKLETFVRAERDRRVCVDAQLRSALARGTGQVVTSIADSTIVRWGTDSIPRRPTGLLWEPTWFTASDCPPEPALP